MKKNYPFLFFIILLSFYQELSSQTYQLIGNPVNTTGWTLVSPAVVSGDFVQLTPDVNNNSGSIKLNEPINLKYCDKWKIEFDFRMDSSQTYNGDGIAFWYLANPPVTSVLGSGIGIPQNAIGFMVGFDSFNNATGSSGMSKVHVAYGQVANTTDTNNVEFFNVPGSSFHSPDLNATHPFQGTTYKHVVVTAEVDPAAPANWIVNITLDGAVICNNVSFAPSGAAAGMTVGYFGFSASTGGARSRHSIKNVKIFVDKVPLLTNAISKDICPDLTGMSTVDLTSFNSQLTVNPSLYNFSYYITGSGTPIANPTNFQYNATTNISVVIKDPSSVLCDNNDASIVLKVAPTVTTTDATLRSCFIETKPSTGLFDLTTAPVIGSSTGITKTYFPSLTDAQNGTNEILNPNNYIAPSGVVYIKVTNSFGCYDIAKVTLIITPPVYSSVLKDKIICIEDKTTLDAGPGFTGYEWSTGAVTPSINNVGVGTYWVKLKTGNCIATQTVKVYASEQPVISSVDISNNTVTVYAVGGTAPYKYSMDGINWQDSNEFKNVPRGDGKIYVKDAYDCDPIDITIIVPNLINVITPNGDGINDAIDYSALAGKQNLVFNVFDRYGAQIHHADKSNRYRWDGTVAGRKVPTGNYWYSVSWNENDKKNTPVKYSGWILVKNRD
ncbi:gliding motility-associated C-terminal domain-containing protein [Chryseobacterium sp. RU37D]|uniref:T9SS type B sorting domain-containing protein n=1 Tax=Chryseobacterium sp. RU37D TaxID=1907397 RepID=UPI0009551E45|nr:T9SS type B sorting domain-containing protein [Chryseobacterium sp. RU37D]SIQ67165.1 gliding motility-associated C-terminal domain-containing protein [Chryseobacterium sp. RU37D]